MKHRYPPIFNGIPLPEGLTQSSARPFFNRAVGRAFDVHAAGDVTEIDLYDEIGIWGIDSAAFRRQLKGAGDIRLRINSPGGDVFDGIAMHNDLRDHAGRVDVEIAGIAASAASIVAMAGDTISIAENAFVMIHNAWTIALGDRRDLEKTASVLSEIDAALADTYARRTGATAAAMAALMDEETWLRGADAVGAGFADAVADLPDPQAIFDLSGYRNAPKGLSRVPEAPEDLTTRDLERLLTQDAGLSRSKARALLRGELANAASRDAGGASAETMQDAGDDAEFIAAFRPLLDTLTKGS